MDIQQMRFNWLANGLWEIDTLPLQEVLHKA